MEKLDKDTLKVGDTVGIERLTIIGWRYFRYSEIKPKTIKRITPARTKFVMTDDLEYNKNTAFYKIDNETRRRNHVIDCAIEIGKSINKLDESFKHGNLLRKSDDKIIKISEMLKELCKEIEVEEK